MSTLIIFCAAPKIRCVLGQYRTATTSLLWPAQESVSSPVFRSHTLTVRSENKQRKSFKIIEWRWCPDQSKKQKKKTRFARYSFSRNVFPVKKYFLFMFLHKVEIAWRSVLWLLVKCFFTLLLDRILTEFFVYILKKANVMAGFRQFLRILSSWRANVMLCNPPPVSREKLKRKNGSNIP